MATVTKGRTFVSGEIITPAKLNDVVDLATVTEIVNADIKSDAAIALSKLAAGALPTAITVATANIVDSNVTAAKLASNAVETAKIADDAVTNDKLSLAANAGEIKKALNADNAPPIFACRAWVNFDGTRNEADTGASTNGNNVKIRASGNVASVLKNSAGDYTVTFTTAMPDENYAAFVNSRSFNNIVGFSYENTGAINNSSSYRFTTSRDLNAALFDTDSISVAIFR